MAAEFPGRKRQVEGGDLGTTRVELQAVQVFGDHPQGRLGFAQALLVHTQGSKHRKKRRHKMARTHTRIEGRDRCRAIRPTRELARSRSTIVQAAQVSKFEGRLLARMAAQPPGPQGIVDEKMYHVRLSEELGHGGQFFAVDFVPTFVDAVFGLTLPKLVHPTQGIVGSEDVGFEAIDELFQLDAVVGSKGHLHQRILGAKNSWEHARSVAGGGIPFVGKTLLGGQFLTIRHGDRHPIRVHQQVIGLQELGEEHFVPGFVRQFVAEVFEGSGAIQAIAQEARLGAEHVAQSPLGGAQVYKRLGMVDGQGLQGVEGSGFGLFAGQFDSRLKSTALGRGKCCHYFKMIELAVSNKVSSCAFKSVT